MAEPLHTKLRLRATAVPMATLLVRHRAVRSAVERWPVSLVAKAGVPSSSPPTELADGFGPEVALPLVSAARSTVRGDSPHMQTWFPGSTRSVRPHRGRFKRQRECALCRFGGDPADHPIGGLDQSLG